MNNKNKNGKTPTVKKEENAVVLDYLSRGYIKSDMSKFGGKPIAQAIGTERFTLLELSPKNSVDLEMQETVYIGRDKREKIYKVLGKLDFENLTATSRIELDYAIRDIVEANEEKYVEFFNTADSVSTRLHSLELIPGIGEKVANCILVFGCGHLEAFPVDTWIKKAIEELEKEKPFSIEEVGPYGGYIQQYLFYHTKNSKSYYINE